MDTWFLSILTQVSEFFFSLTSPEDDLEQLKGSTALVSVIALLVSGIHSSQLKGNRRCNRVVAVMVSSNLST